jgi:hypothetical protein
MTEKEEEERCYVCKKGRFSKRIEELAFHQSTDKGYVYCRLVIPMNICNHCGHRDWSEETEALINKTVRQKYDSLP